MESVYGEKEQIEVILNCDNYDDYTYTWKYKSLDTGIETALDCTSPSYQIDSFQLADIGEYFCTVKQKDGTESKTIKFERYLNPTIAWKSGGEDDEYGYYQSRKKGDSITFKFEKLVVDQSFDCRFVWSHNGEAIANATTATYQFTVGSKTNFGSYSCQVILSKNNKVYRIAKKMFYLSDNGYIRASNSYNTYSGCIGDKLDINVGTVTDSDNLPARYQWLKFNDESKEWNALPADNRATLSLTLRDNSDFGVYHCIVSTYNGDNVMHSTECEYYVNDKMKATFEYTSDEVMLGYGDKATLETKVKNDYNYELKYQWYYENYWDETRTLLPGATNKNLEFTTTSEDSFGQYVCVLTAYNGDKIVNTDEKSFYVSYKDEFAFLNEYEDVGSDVENVKLGEKAEITPSRVRGVDKGYMVEYQWYKASDDYETETKIDGATKSSYQIDKVEETDYGNYTLKARLVKDEVVWASAKTYCTLYKEIGLKLQQDQSISYVENDVYEALAVNVSCDSEYEDDLTYQWYGKRYDEGDSYETRMKGATSREFHIILLPDTKCSIPIGDI